MFIVALIAFNVLVFALLMVCPKKDITPSEDEIMEFQEFIKNNKE